MMLRAGLIGHDPAFLAHLRREAESRIGFEIDADVALRQTVEILEAAEAAAVAMSS